VIEEFNLWFSEYIENHKFKSTDIQQFNLDIKNKFGFDFYPYLNSWFNGKEQPGFLFTDLKVYETIVGERSRYYVTFSASNSEPVAGLFNVSFAKQGHGKEASDISKIVLLDPNESKKIGIVLDAEPRAMIINTIFAKNIPGEITIPVNDIIKNKSLSGEFEEEEVLTSVPSVIDPNETVVDNEDQGFSPSGQNIESPLKKLLGVKNRNPKTYLQIAMWNTPEYWQPVVLTTYYGKYIRSAVYTRAGTGDKTLTWTTIIKEPGYYDIYSYVGKTTDRMKVKTGRDSGKDDQTEEQQGDDTYKDMHYKIHHDEGEEEITLDYQAADGGWNSLGRYHLSADTARVVLTNKSAGRIVIGDAIKWVRQR
jgi:hypothetical protein